MREAFTHFDFPGHTLAQNHVRLDCAAVDDLVNKGAAGEREDR
jgi:hypothetical protein